jgi:ribosomal protein S18 acetylase RimI-like enzyme
MNKLSRAFKPGVLLHSGTAKDGRDVTVRTLSRSDSDINSLDSAEYRLDVNYELEGMRRHENVFLIAKVEGECAGYCRVDNPHHGTYAYVHMVYVAAEHRRNGIGGILVDVALAAAKELGISSIFLYSEHAGARALYRSRGFKPDRLHGMMRGRVR